MHSFNAGVETTTTYIAEINILDKLSNIYCTLASNEWHGELYCYCIILCCSCLMTPLMTIIGARPLGWLALKILHMNTEKRAYDV